MSEMQKFVGKFQLRPRLENESDKDYFERVTGCNYQRYDNFVPHDIEEAIHDNDLTHHDIQFGRKGYLCLENSMYEFIEIEERDVCENYCYLEKIDDGTYRFDAQFYNGGTCLSEMIEWGFRKVGKQ